MSVEEYLEFEKGSPVKHEYVGGHVYAMVGASRRHSRISGKIFRKLADAADGGPCRVHQSDMKVPTPDNLFYCPEVVVACGPEPLDPYLEDEPCLIVKILSPSTEATDRREKLLSYRKIRSLQAYLTVEHDEARIEHHYRNEQDGWQTEVVEDGAVATPCPPDAELPLADVYRGL